MKAGRDSNCPKFQQLKRLGIRCKFGVKEMMLAFAARFAKLAFVPAIQGE